MKHIVYLCVLILSLLPLERADAQRHVTVYDPEVSRPVQGFHVWADKLKADTTNVFGSAEVPEKFDTLFLVKPAKRRRDNRNAKKMAKIFKRMDEADNDPIIHAYRKALGIKTKH